MNKAYPITIEPIFALDSPFNLSADFSPSSHHQHMQPIQQSIRLIQRSYAGLLNTAQVQKAQQRLQYLQQLVLDLKAHLDGQNGLWSQDVLRWANQLMNEAHTNFYIRYYLLSIGRAAQSRRPEVIQRYLQQGMEILLTGLNDCYADHATIQQYVQRYARLQGHIAAF